MKHIAVVSLIALALAACQGGQRSANQMPSFYVSLTNANAVVDAATARDMISAYRGNKGLGRLALDPDLQAEAEAEADAMAAADKPSSAETLKSRLAAKGVIAPAVNLSAGYHTLAEAFSGWRESPQHDRVLLDPQATRMGIATAYTPRSKYKVYWVLVVAGPKR
ncbi:CAP domain-containing protein [Microvirga terricola]|uniref:CAP domain-containing protein n=1 Tax=Microvirga terricola TaxID=2719797 RepID=A0ABX0V5V9_9HYPH|nr:CAP domain-containing protein [Microvirga terricola]NIX75179.1 CAP domain-containing protein [Microvirga terricola]